jgi:hypothetical protein
VRLRPQEGATGDVALGGERLTAIINAELPDCMFSPPDALAVALAGAPARCVGRAHLLAAQAGRAGASACRQRMV